MARRRALRLEFGRGGARRLAARWPGHTGGTALGGTLGWAAVVRRGRQEREQASREWRKAGHERGQGQGERGEAGGQRRRAEQDGEQAQDGPDHAKEGFERQEQQGGGHLEIGLQGLLG